MFERETEIQPGFEAGSFKLHLPLRVHAVTMETVVHLVNCLNFVPLCTFLYML